MNGAISAEYREIISKSLREIESEESAHIAIAVESGSRAWGFHSDDSDYDVRFLYIRPVDWHLTIRPGRDVIERPISDELDIGGWDLRKALGLILGSNAVVLEWLHSPIRYREHPELRDELMEFCADSLQRAPLTYHYLRLATRQRADLRDRNGQIKLKRYFYTIRPALALRWLRLHPDKPLVPMHMEALMDETDVPANVRSWIENLIDVKRESGEMGAAQATDPATDALLDAEFNEAQVFLDVNRKAPRDHLMERADSIHQKWVHRIS